jgi:hypothetical protein
MVKAKVGVQVLLMKFSVCKDYTIWVPRFILIRSNGKNCKSDAARPSSPVLKESWMHFWNPVLKHKKGSSFFRVYSKV